MTKQNLKIREKKTLAISQPNSTTPQWRILFLRVALAFTMMSIVSLLMPVGIRNSMFITSCILLIFLVCLKSLQIAYPGRFTFSDLQDRVFAWYESLERHQQLYVNVPFLALFLAYVYVLDARNIYPSLGLLFILYCFGVAIYDVLRIYGSLLNSLLGKSLIAVCFAIGSNLAFCFAGWIVGEMTHVAPMTFPHTMSFLAIGAIPFLFLLVGAIYIPIAFLLAPTIAGMSMFEKQVPRLMKYLFAHKFEKPTSRFVLTTFLFQFVFYTCLVSLTPKLFFPVINKYEKHIERTIATSIYKFDMYPGTECNSRTEYRVGALGDENYIFASRTGDEVKFEKPRKCTPKEE